MSRRAGLIITAYSLCNGLGRTTEEVVAALAASRTGLGPPCLELPFDTVCGLVPGELPPLTSRVSAYDARQARIALLTLEPMRAPLQAASRRWGADRLAIVMSTSTGGISVSEEAYDAFKKTGRLPEGYEFEKQHPFFAFAELLRGEIGARGPTYVVSTACSSSTKALASALRLVAADLADAVLVGGVDSICRTTLHGFAGLGVLSKTYCRPFSRDRAGMNIGEGGAMILLERSGDGRAVLLGAGESSDAHHMSSPHPEALGARLAVQAALDDAGLEPSSIDYVNAHGTATKLNDAAEAGAIAAIFGDAPPVVSTKGYTGHLLGAAGATEAVFATLATEQDWIPASLGSRPPDPEFAIRLNTERTDHRCEAAISLSFGFGGSNAAVVVGKP